MSKNTLHKGDDDDDDNNNNNNDNNTWNPTPTFPYLFCIAFNEDKKQFAKLYGKRVTARTCNIKDILL